MRHVKPFAQGLEMLVIEINEEIATKKINMGSFLKRLHALGVFLQPYLSNDIHKISIELEPFREIFAKLYALARTDYNDLLRAIIMFHSDTASENQIIHALIIAIGCYQNSMENAPVRIKLQTNDFGVCFKTEVRSFVEEQDANNKIVLILKMKGLVQDLKKLAVDITGEKKYALQNLISEITLISNLYLRNEKSTTDEVKKLYCDAFNKVKKDLAEHRDPAIQRIFLRMARLVGYGLTLGGLYFWESRQDKPFVWSDVAKTYHRVENKLAAVLGVSFKLGYT